MNYNLIVAVCNNNGIGYKGHLPFTYKEDLRNFSKVTRGCGNNAIIMGRTTWLSLPNRVGLHGRDNFILSQSMDFEQVMPDGYICKTFKNIELLDLFLYEKNKYDDIFIIGGADIYKQYLKKEMIKRCFVTYINEDFTCDTFIDSFYNNFWKLINSKKVCVKKNDIDTIIEFCEYSFI